MAKEVEFRLNTTAKDARWMRGTALTESVKLDPTQVQAAIERSMQPALLALRSNVATARPKTGRLLKSPGILTRKYGGARRLVVVGLVGYKSRVAPHARYLEFGTPPVGNRRGIKARRYAWLAYFQNQDQMKATAKAALENLIANATSSVR